VSYVRDAEKPELRYEVGMMEVLNMQAVRTNRELVVCQVDIRAQ